MQLALYICPSVRHIAQGRTHIAQVLQLWRLAPAKVKTVLTRRVAYVAHVQLAPAGRDGHERLQSRGRFAWQLTGLADSLRHKRRKTSATKDQREERLAADSLRKQRSTAEETLQQHATRLTHLRLTQAQRLAAGTEEQWAARLQQFTSNQVQHAPASWQMCSNTICQNYCENRHNAKNTASLWSSAGSDHWKRTESDRCWDPTDCSTMLYQVQPEADHHKCLLARIKTLLFQHHSVHFYLLLLCCSQFDTLLLRLGLSSLITTSCSYSVYTLLLQYYYYITITICMVHMHAYISLIH